MSSILCVSFLVHSQTQKFEADLSGAGTWDASQRSVELARLGIEDCDLIDSKVRRRLQRGKNAFPHPLPARETSEPSFPGASCPGLTAARSGEHPCNGLLHMPVILEQARKRPRPEDINHPALLGYFLRRRSARKTWDSTVRRFSRAAEPQYARQQSCTISIINIIITIVMLNIFNQDAS